MTTLKGSSNAHLGLGLWANCNDHVPSSSMNVKVNATSEYRTTSRNRNNYKNKHEQRKQMDGWMDEWMEGCTRVSDQNYHPATLTPDVKSFDETSMSLPRTDITSPAFDHSSIVVTCQGT
jgi:hypothetical protein